MIIVLKPDSTEEQIDHILERIRELGFKPHLSKGQVRTIIGVIGDEDKVQAEPLSAIPGVEQVLPILKPFKLASREFHAADTAVEVGPVRVGAGSLVDALEVFKGNKLNLTWIESFPAKDGNKEYMFFVDFDGHVEDPKVKRALNALAEHCEQLTVLGSFPVATLCQ